MDISLKLGKLPARPDAVTFKFGAYGKTLPKPPAAAGHKDLIQAWGMLGNDRYGDCVWAGAAHETMLWNKTAAKDVPFSDESVLSAYTAVTGFNPDDPSTDSGTDMQLAASYRRKTGMKDANGAMHTIAAYLAIQNVTELKQAIWLFEAVGIGVQFPASAMQQFNAGKPWTVVKSQIEGGHYIPGLSYDAKGIYVVTWGKVQLATWGFIKKYMDEAIVYLSPEMFTNGKSIEGFDLVTLQKDIASL